MKPQCEHIDEADGDLGVDEYTIAVAASAQSLQLFLLVNH